MYKIIQYQDGLLRYFAGRLLTDNHLPHKLPSQVNPEPKGMRECTCRKCSNHNHPQLAFVESR